MYLSLAGVRSGCLARDELASGATVPAAALQEFSRKHPGTGRKGQQLTLSLGDGLILAVAEEAADKVVSKGRYWSELEETGCLTIDVVSVAPPKLPSP